VRGSTKSELLYLPMSKFRVRTVFGAHIKPVELNRSNYSFNELRDEVRVKHELRDFQLRYQSPSLGDLFIQDNDSFHRIVKDAEMRGAPYIEVRIISHEKPTPTGKGGHSAPSYNAPSQSHYNAVPQSNYSAASPSYSAPNYGASSPSSSYSAPSYGNAPQQRNVASPTPPRVESPAVGAGNVVASFTVTGNLAAGADRLSMKADQAADHFAFIPIPAKFDSAVSIVLDNSKLTCESVTNHPDGRSIKFTQAFNLPFQPLPQNIQLHGQVLKIFFS